MQKYKKLIPIIAVILIALGVNLERFGIDLEALTDQGSGSDSSYSQTQQSREPTQSASKKATPSSSVGREAPSAVDNLPHWSDTNPEINLWHVFQGEINRKGKPTGFHSRPGGKDPANARLRSIRDRPNRAGVYTANIEVRDGGQWKSKFSSFFPDDMSQREVIDVILHAYKNSSNPRAQPWSGPSGLGFQVQGYTSSRGGINTAFPVYSGSQ